MSSGKQKTSLGEIDWIQMNRAEGDNFAIISQRYFDLEFGKTIVVIPHKDGSLRFLQLKHTIVSFPGAFNEEWDEKLNKFYEELKKDKELLDYINHPNVIEQPIN